MTNDGDVIIVWYCTSCSAYDINFKVDITDKFYCSLCGLEMTLRRYKEVKK